MGYIGGNNELGDNLPSNLGGVIGKTADMGMGYKFNEIGYTQATLGLTNDVASFVVSGGTGGAYSKYLLGEKALWYHKVGYGLYPYSTVTGFNNNAKAFPSKK